MASPPTTAAMPMPFLPLCASTVASRAAAAGSAKPTARQVEIINMIRFVINLFQILQRHFYPESRCRLDILYVCKVFSYHNRDVGAFIFIRETRMRRIRLVQPQVMRPADHPAPVACQVQGTVSGNNFLGCQDWITPDQEVGRGKGQ